MPSITLTERDLDRIANLSSDDLVRLHSTVMRRIRVELPRHLVNETVFSTRLPAAAADFLTAMAVRLGRTRSEVLREVVLAFVDRNGILV